MEEASHDSAPENNRRLNFPPERPHFFKIILSYADQNERVSIPKEFLSKYQIQIYNSVLLMLPNRTVWRIGITKACDQVWMEFGWEKFTKHYSIRFGHLLVFRYDGGYKFQVIIIDNKDACEIEYPLPRKPKLPVMNGGRKRSKADAVDFRDCHDDTTSEEEEEEEEEEASGEDESKKDEEVQVVQEDQEDIPISQGLGPLCLKTESFKRVSSFKSDYPFCVVFMNPSYVTGKCRVYLPAQFVRQYLSYLPTSIKLSNSDDERMWPVNCSGRCAGKYCLNWSSFANDNKLKIGDVCVYELVKRNNVPHLRVVVSKKEDMLVDEEPAQPIETEMLTLLKAESFESQYPWFNVVIRKSYIQRGNCLHIPVSFSKANCLRPSKVVLSVSDGRTWTIRCKGDDYLSLSWITFVRDNNLNVGDSCIFELIKNDKVSVFKVSVFRDRCPDEDDKEEEGKGTKTLQRNDTKEKEKVTEGIEEDKTAAIERALAYKSEHPSAAVLLRKSYLSERYDLCLPRLFTRQHFASKPKTAILCISSDEKTWPVNCFSRVSRDNRSIQGFRWESFAIDNDLKEGDACVLELIKDGDKPLIRVIIFRKFHDQQDHSNLSSGMASGKRTREEEDDFIKPKSKIRKGKSIYCETDMDADEEPTPLERAKAFKSEYPYVVITVQPSYINGTNGLCLPRKFAREYLTIDTKQVKLRVRENGKEWDVICCHRATNVSVVHLAWYQFVKENNLKISDVCVFMVIEKTTPVLEVVIFRNTKVEEEELTEEDSD